jgi:hypothetical protein
VFGSYIGSRVGMVSLPLRLKLGSSEADVVA